MFMRFLRGSDANRPNRIVLVTGHYDSRNSDIFNGTDPRSERTTTQRHGGEPGVRPRIEQSCRENQVPATIVFLTVAGEEQD